MIYPTERLEAFLVTDDSAPVICRRLVDAANEAGGADNITVVLVRVGASSGGCDG